MFDHISEHREEKRKKTTLDGVLEMWLNTVLSVWYIFSIEQNLRRVRPEK